MTNSTVRGFAIAAARKAHEEDFGVHRGVYRTGDLLVYFNSHPYRNSLRRQAENATITRRLRKLGASVLATASYPSDGYTEVMVIGMADGSPLAADTCSAAEEAIDEVLAASIYEAIGAGGRHG